MLLKKTGKLILFLLAVLCFQSAVFTPVRAADGEKVKELNFVFLHGMGGNPCAFQGLSDQINNLLPYFIDRYHEKYPEVSIRVNMLDRCYPGYLDIGVWAANIAESINEHFKDRDNLILVGHSMGGKTALYAAAHNTGNISDRIAAVITINSPVRSLSGYYVPNGGSMADYCRASLLGNDAGICNSLAFYDSSADGLKISREKHWLAFVSAEDTPLSPRYDRSGVDIWPRNMDDGVVPLSAQFAEGADVVYYGAAHHSDVGAVEEISKNLANHILLYIFGYPIEFSVPNRSGTLEHDADWLLGTDSWSDIVGGIASSNGTITHRNSAFYKWQQWEDIIGECKVADERSYSHIHLASVPLLTSIRGASWYNTENTSDCRLKVKSSAAPLSTIKIEWTVFSAGILPKENPRSFYDVEISRGTPLASITGVSWWKDDPLNPVVFIHSEAQSPFRWFEAKWSTYMKETRTVVLIDEIPVRLVKASDLN